MRQVPCAEAPDTIAWDDSDGNLRYARTRLDVGSVVYLTVENLESTGWDWVVWDGGSQVIPRYGRAETATAAKRRAEMTVTEVNMRLIEISAAAG